jgi:hypothetical protein
MMFAGTRLKIRSYLQNRYDSSGKSEVELYYGEQMAYGHREVLLDYLGVSREFYFKAALTHGKILPDKFDPITPLFRRDGSQIPHVLWRSDGEIEARAKGLEAVSIGATGLYALHNLGQSISETRSNVFRFSRNHSWSDNNVEIKDLLSGKKVLYMPQHSWDGDVVNHSNSDLGILKMLNPKNISVILGYLDFLDFDSRNYYESLGFKVSCAGIRSSKVFASPAGGREKFLYSLFNIISQSDFVVSNSFTTGLFYATCLGKKIGILPDVGIQKFIYSKWRNSNEFNLDIEAQKYFFPWLTDAKSCIPQLIQSDLSNALGLDKFRSPIELQLLVPLVTNRIVGKPKD